MAYDWTRLTTTARSAKTGGVKIVVYGPAGVGKTTLAATCTPHDSTKTLLISAESGTRPLRNLEIPEAPVTTWQDFGALHADLASGLANGGLPYDWIVVDSLSEIVERCLESTMEAHKGKSDNWAIYRELATESIDLMKKFRDLKGVNVLFTCEQERDKTDTGLMLYQPSIPGNKASRKLTHIFDEIWAYRVERDAQGTVRRFIQTQPCHQYTAKSRSGLGMYESPDIGAIMARMASF
jgi:GTPase SAR1 family protein